MMGSAAILEICVDDRASLRAAVSGGADRIELCSALALGGLTPSEGFAYAALQTELPIHAMIRPRAGDFAYDDDELALIAGDIRRFADLGIAGVVVGAADSGSNIDERALAMFRDAAKDIAITLHRVIDLAPDPVAATHIAANLGYDYVLTSGGARRAIKGKAVIARMVAETAGGLSIIAGSGVTPENAVELIRDTGVAQIHASATQTQEWSNSKIEEFGFASGPRRLTEAARVAALKQAIMSVGQGRS